MNNIIKYLIIVLCLCSCEKEDIPVLDLRTSGEEVTKIELRADHKTLIPNGDAKMEFYTFVYGTKKVVGYHLNDENVYVTDTTEMEYLIPNDQLPVDFVKVYDLEGKELADRVYSTTTASPGSVLEFYAKANTVESNRLAVTIRELPDESYEELVIPVIFHMLVPPVGSGPTYDISEKYLQDNLDRMNAIFNRKMTTDPNGGNVKITFKLAEYSNAGIKLQEKGKNLITLFAANITTIDAYYQELGDLAKAYNRFIIKSKNNYVWNPNRYLNIWLIKFSAKQSELGGYSYKYSGPTVMHTDYNLNSIPGFKFQSVSSFGLSDVTDCLEVGAFVNYNAFLNPQTQGNNEFSLATVIGGYYGLLETNCDDYRDLNVDGDNDYCQDTYLYDYAYFSTIFKQNKLYKQPADWKLEWFTSFGVMDRYSRKNSVSVDQAARMRKVLKQCPSRWSYKSQWAFTGRAD